MTEILFFQITSLLNAASSLFACLIVYRNNPRSYINRTFAYFSFSVFFWQASYFVWQISTNAGDALFWCKMLSIGAIFIPATFVHFVTRLLNKYEEHSKTVLFLYIVSVILIFVAFTPYFVKDVRPRLFFPYWPTAGSLYIFYVIELLILVFYAHILLYQEYTKASGYERLCLKYVFYGTMIAYLGGMTNLPLWYDIPVPPYGNILVIFYVIIFAYSIIRYNFMDIQIVIRKSAVYTFLAASISLLYLLIVLGLEKLFQTWFGYKSPKISIATAFVIGLLAVPLRQRIQAFVDRYFFKGTQQEIASQNEQLRQEIAQSEKYKTLSTLAGGIAHEIRNPLTVLKAFYEHFPQKKDDPEFLAKFTRITDKEIGRIEGLIQQLLDFAKPSPPSFQDTDIHRLIEDTLDLLANKLKTRNIQLNHHLSPITLKIDPNQIKQALLNILLNAIEAMPDGGQLTAASFVERTSYIVTISDTGTGIAAKDLPHIFDPFFSKKETGTGLGLAITKTIIEEHKGRIKVKSEPGKGTEFTIELPITQ